MGTDVDRLLANSPAEYLTLGENEVMDAPAVITYTYQPGTPAGDRLYLEAKAGSTMQVAVILRNETAGEGLAALQIKMQGRGCALVVKLSMDAGTGQSLYLPERRAAPPAPRTAQA